MAAVERRRDAVPARPARRPTTSERERLAARGIRSSTGEVAGLEVTDDRLTGVRLAYGRGGPGRGAGGRSRASPPASDLLAGLGLKPTELEMHGHRVGTQVEADPTGATAVPGVWVAGNVADLRAQVITSAAAGLTAAAAINADLIAEDTDAAVAARRRHCSPNRSGRSGTGRTSTSWSGRPNAAAGRRGGRPPARVRRWTPAAARAPTRSGSRRAAGGSPRWTSRRPRWTARPPTPTPPAWGTAITWTHADLTTWTPPERVRPGHRAVRAPAGRAAAGAVRPARRRRRAGRHAADRRPPPERPGDDDPASAVPGPVLHRRGRSRRPSTRTGGRSWSRPPGRARPSIRTEREITVHDTVLRARRRTR